MLRLKLIIVLFSDFFLSLKEYREVMDSLQFFEGILFI